MARKIGYVWEAAYGWVDTGSGGFFPADHAMGLQPISHHVAHADTKRRFHEAVEVSKLSNALTKLKPEPAQVNDLLRVHTEEHISSIQTQSESHKGGDAGDGVSPFGKGGYEIGLLSAGGAIRVVEAVVSGEVQQSYALINPPGHHAERAKGMGFCLFNNVSVAAAYAKEKLGISKVAIVDWDVHHGNGTQDIWWDDPSVLTISVHQNKCFPPTSGFREENGGDNAKGTNINIPLPPGSGNTVYELAMDKVVIPSLEAFKPELILIASGFDASVMDPLARQMVTQAGFKRLTRKIIETAEDLCDGRAAFIQEGGYSPYYVAFCGLGVLEELTGLTSGFGDPFGELFAAQGVDDIAPHQRTEVEKASELIARIPKD